MAERGDKSGFHFNFNTSHNKSHGFEDNKQRKQFRDYQDTSQAGSFKRHKTQDQNMTNYKGRDDSSQYSFTKISKPEKPRKYTLSIAVPASILDATSIKDELRTYVVGQIARAAVIYSVDEIVIYDEGCSSKNDYEQRKNSQMAIDKMKILLEYQELPQYLRKYFFGFDKNLRCVGLLNPLNASHHFKYNDWCEYREGVVVEDTEGKSPYVDVGLRKNVQIDQKLECGLRVTIKLQAEAPDNIDDPCGDSFASVVSPDEPRTTGGYYWGYSVRVANSLSEVVTGSKFSGGYDLLIGTSDKGNDARKVKFPKFSHAMIVFGGVEGLETAIEADSQIKASDPFKLFDLYINTCLLQQVRTIRTEEAILISLCALNDKLCAKGIQ